MRVQWGGSAILTVLVDARHFDRHFSVFVLHLPNDFEMNCFYSLEFSRYVRRILYPVDGNDRERCSGRFSCPLERLGT